jgi:hypothetical protein
MGGKWHDPALVRPKTHWYTVVGMCEEERHAYHIKARSPKEAERICKKQHDKTSYVLVIAGTFKGKLVAVL